MEGGSVDPVLPVIVQEFISKISKRSIRVGIGETLQAIIETLFLKRLAEREMSLPSQKNGSGIAEKRKQKIKKGMDEVLQKGSKIVRSLHALCGNGEILVKEQKAKALLPACSSGKIKEEEGEEEASRNITEVFQPVFGRIKEVGSAKGLALQIKEEKEEEQVKAAKERNTVQVDIEESQQAKNQGKRFGKGSLSADHSAQ